MDLDFSFTLVSSLTPRSKVLGTPQIENKHSSKSLRITHKSKVPNNIPLCENWKKSEKENYIPVEQLMNNNESCTSSTDFTPTSGTIENVNNSNDLETMTGIDLANVAVRRNRFRDRRKANSNPLQCSDNRLSHVESSSEVNQKSDFNNGSNKIDNLKLCTRLTDNESKKHGVKRKSVESQIEGISYSHSAHSSLDSIENSVSDSENIPVHKKGSFTSNTDPKGTFEIFNNSGVTELSISPAYSSDSFVRSRRKGAKVILETPETDLSLKNNDDSKEHDLCNNVSIKRDKKRNSIAKVENVTPQSSFSIVKSPNGVKQFLSKPFTFNVGKRGDSECAAQDVITNISTSPVNEHNTGNEVVCKKQNNHGTSLKKDKNKSKLSPVLKEKNSNEVGGSKYPSDKKCMESNICFIDLTLNNKPPVCTNQIKKKGNKEIIKQNKGKGFLQAPKGNTASRKPSLILPTEIIPKFEHITNWLRSTEQQSVLPVSSEAFFDSPKPSAMPAKQISKLIGSLSPRIKEKMKVAKSSLEEERKLFEDLYGDARSISDGQDEVTSAVNFHDSVELSEKVLEKLYGTVWQKNTVLPQSEPKNRQKQKNKSKKKTPQTERKKQRTSIYDVFSSSSSEDRFEEFLENVQRGRIESKGKNNKYGPSPPDFINDSDSESNCSLTFYQNIVSSAVKEDVNKLTHDLYESKRKPTKVNRRRLSFTSCKDDGSESGKIGIKPVRKRDNKPTKDIKSQKGNESKKVDNKIQEETSASNYFNLVTPIKINDESSDKPNAKLEKELNPITKSVGKLRTPKNTIQSNSDTSSEERLKVKYLSDKDFKVPISVKTPVNSAKKNFPSSPALSFLSSLSEVTAGLPCHPDARIYKKDFKNTKQELTKKLFSLYNKEVFENKLPADMLIEWNTRMTSTSGYCYNKRIYRNNQVFRSSRIVLSTKILDRADRLRDTLIHELCHAATWIVNETSDGHGPKWRAWADKANRRFPELPVIKRCHDYAINTKYTYKCLSCGYCIGRHSKSLDTDRKRCGFCYGKFQVFVTAKMSSASATSGSDSVKTQKTPTGFALFVKENYATVKKENNVPHGQVMKLLGQKFSELKIAKSALET